ncbi:DUF4262 domain-containing protein [Streptomyces sp. NPDC056099]|uniref:DUF4262 domain-containing protein n=1 Tax=unclassified Streptomyces TaxID=2593676 RepID=UPI0035D82931
MTLYDSDHQVVLPPHTVRWIFDPDGRETPFAYTVGLASRPGRSYELATFGLPGRLAHAVITCAAEQLVRDHLDPAEGLELDEVLRGGLLVRLRLAKDTSKFTGAREESGPDVPVWQILTPDKWGHFPDDRNFTEDPDAQPFV